MNDRPVMIKQDEGSRLQPWDRVAESEGYGHDEEGDWTPAHRPIRGTRIA